MLLIASVYFISLVVFAGVHAKQHHGYDDAPIQFVLWNPEIFLGATLGVLAVIFIGSAYKTNELSAGGSAVATLMGGRLVNQNTTDANERKLLNVVEEMSIASGVPMPQVYVLNDERGINAFAAGHTTGDAAIGVTRGCIEMLSRDELQGVIGHEFSHILNGDMRMNLRLIGIIFGLLCLATIGRVLLYARSSNSRDKNPLPILGLALDCARCHRRFFWPADSSRRQPPARISRRRLLGAVHAQSRRTFRRAPKNRPLQLRFQTGIRTTRPTCATCFSATASAIRSSAQWPRTRRFPTASAPLIRRGTENFHRSSRSRLKPSSTPPFPNWSTRARRCRKCSARFSAALF